MLSLSLIASAATFRVQAPRQVIAGNTFQITYVLENADGEGFKQPDVPNCKLLYGPATSRSQSVSIVNGKRSSTSSIGYTFTYRAEKQGTVTVGSAKIGVDGKTLTTSAIKLEILPPDRSASSGSQQSVQAYDVNTQTSGKPIGSDEVFVRVVLSKPTVYEQEGVLSTMKLYSKYQISKFQALELPTYNDFLAEEVPVTLNGSFENYNGENYYVYVLKQVVLFPQKSGVLEVSSGTYELSVVQFDIINTAFGRMRTPVDRSLKIKSNSTKLNVKPLPSPRPADFIGAVGTGFKISSKLNNKAIRTNEASTLTLQLSGSGNLKSLSAPRYQFPSQFDLYDPQTKIDAKPSGNFLTGTVNVDYTFVPQSVGKFTIGGGTCSYFNVKTGKYESIPFEGKTVDVAKGSSSSTVKFGSEPMRDILPVFKGDLELSRSASIVLGSWYNWVYYLLLTLAFASVLFIYRKTVKERANVTLMKRKGANRVAGKRLKRAKMFMNKGKKEAFYEEMLTALWGYFSDKLSIPVSELNRDNISRELLDYGMTEDGVNRIIRILDECEFSRYARPADSEMPMADVYSQACDAIGEVESTKRPNKK